MKRLLISSSIPALLAISGFGTLTPAEASCTVDGTPASADIRQPIRSGQTVVCDAADTGRRVQSFDGRAVLSGGSTGSNSVPAAGFDATIRTGANLVAPGPGGTGNGANIAALFFGPGSTATIEQGGQLTGAGGGPGLIVFTDTGGRLVNSGTLSVTGEGPAVEGALSGAVAADGLAIVNRGTITTSDLAPALDTSVGGELRSSSTIEAASGSTIRNSGTIQRR